MKLSHRTKTSVEIIFDHLTDMQKFASVHPVICKIDKLGDKSYLVHESLKILFIPFSFAYPVAIENNIIDKTINFQAKVFKMIEIEIYIALLKDGNHTIINEQIIFNTFLPVKYLIGSVFKKQHTQLFKNIELAAIA